MIVLDMTMDTIPHSPLHTAVWRHISFFKSLNLEQQLIVMSILPVFFVRNKKKIWFPKKVLDLQHQNMHTPARHCSCCFSFRWSSKIKHVNHKLTEKGSASERKCTVRKWQLLCPHTAVQRWGLLCQGKARATILHRCYASAWEVWESFRF